MGEDHGPRARRARREVGSDPVHGGGEHGLVTRLRHAELVLHQGGFEIGQTVEGHVPMRVGEHHGSPARRRLGPQMDAGAPDQSRADAQAAGGVVVSGDHHRRHAEVGEPVQGVVEQLDRGQRRHGPVVHVPRHDHRVHGVLPHGGDEVTDELGLGPEHVDPVERAAEMPVGRVQNPQRGAPACMFTPSPVLEPAPDRPPAPSSSPDHASAGRYLVPHRPRFPSRVRGGHRRGRPCRRPPGGHPPRRVGRPAGGQSAKLQASPYASPPSANPAVPAVASASHCRNVSTSASGRPISIVTASA